MMTLRRLSDDPGTTFRRPDDDFRTTFGRLYDDLGKRPTDGFPVIFPMAMFGGPFSLFAVLAIVVGDCRGRLSGAIVGGLAAARLDFG